jgi:uncharacterized protein
MEHKEALIQQTAAHARSLLYGESTGHDWWHIYRVWQTARRIARHENADSFVVELAALLHDIGDYKFHNGDETVGPRMAREWLETLHIEVETIEHVVEITRDLSFKGAGVATPMRSREGLIVQDADRLDAIGAVGIARAFAYGGHKGRELHNPDVPPQMHASFEQYKNSHSPSINHFYEKLMLLKDRMNTETARRIAAERHRFMEQFLEHFFVEWEGLDYDIPEANGSLSHDSR